MDLTPNMKLYMEDGTLLNEDEFLSGLEGQILVISSNFASSTPDVSKTKGFGTPSMSSTQSTSGTLLSTKSNDTVGETDDSSPNKSYITDEVLEKIKLPCFPKAVKDALKNDKNSELIWDEMMDQIVGHIKMNYPKRMTCHEDYRQFG